MDGPKIMTIEQIPNEIGGKVVEKVEGNIHLGHFIKVGKEN